jgi:hypothetical protein
MLTNETSKKLLARHIAKATPDPLDRTIGRIHQRTVWQKMKWWEYILIHVLTTCVLILTIYLLLFA